MIGKKMKSGTGDKLGKRIQDKILITDDNYVEYTMMQASKELNIPYNSVYNYVRDCGCRTFKELEYQARNRNSLCGRGNSRNKKLYETKYGALTAKEIYNMHPFKKNLKINNISDRLFRVGGMSDDLWSDIKTARGGRRKQAPPNPIITLPQNCKSIIARDFNRATFCRRNGYDDKCKHYSSCSLCRVIKKKHHARYQADGSCYDGEAFIVPSIDVRSRRY